MRGDVYRLKAGDTRGREQSGQRYAVVIQSSDLPLSTWIVAPTSTGRAESSFRPRIELGGEITRVLVDHMRAVDHSVRLGEFAGRLSVAEMQTVDQAIRVVLGLD